MVQTFLPDPTRQVYGSWTFGWWLEDGRRSIAAAKQAWMIQGTVRPPAPVPVAVIPFVNPAVSWVVPAGIGRIKIECLGAGGNSDDNHRSGGAGGAYSCVFSTPVTPGEALTLQVPLATPATSLVLGTDCFVKRGDTTLCLAKSADAAINGSAAAIGGQSSGGVGDVRFSGGNAGTALVASRRTGGGAAAGPLGAGGFGGDADVANGAGGGGANGGGNGGNASTFGVGGRGPAPTYAPGGGPGAAGTKGSGGGGTQLGGGANSHNAEWGGIYGCGSGGGSAGQNTAGLLGGTATAGFGGGAGGTHIAPAGTPTPGGPGLIIISTFAWEPWDLGSALTGWWDAEDPATVSLAGTDFYWYDKVTGVSVSRGTPPEVPVFSPTGFRGVRPGVVFDGVDDYLQRSPLPTNMPSGSTAGEIWTLAEDTAAPADTATRIILATGAGNPTRRYIGRASISGIARGRAANGDSIATAVSATDLTVVYGGAHLTRGIYLPTSVGVGVDGGAITTELSVQDTNNTRVRFGASTTGTPANFWKGSINTVIFINPLAPEWTPANITYLRNWLMARLV